MYITKVSAAGEKMIINRSDNVVVVDVVDVEPLELHHRVHVALEQMYETKFVQSFDLISIGA
jgi:hypothetical protein